MAEEFDYSGHSGQTIHDIRIEDEIKTAYIDYAFDAWSTGASGFMLKPITPDEVREKLSMLRYPLPGGERPWEI